MVGMFDHKMMEGQAEGQDDRFIGVKVKCPSLFVCGLASVQCVDPAMKSTQIEQKQPQFKRTAVEVELVRKELLMYSAANLLYDNDSSNKLEDKAANPEDIINLIRKTLIL
ncbi:hypothetical protein T4C_8736 [Trichinella pseudospiralis]|uniref:Uncharacterized protein n=2 Tax=Trichinella pseudospiralis TaxID=6337 RepID=A0A0V1KFC7_TRIPS|nr:hypothetical protein T4C_8736 [Trichinella pseudospiralis]